MSVHHLHGHDSAQLYLFKVSYENSKSVYSDLFTQVASFLAQYPGASVLSVNGPYLFDDDTLALDILADDV